MNAIEAEKNNFKELLQEIIDAGKDSKLPLKMYLYVSYDTATYNERDKINCGTACCLCGDVAISRIPDGSFSDVMSESSYFASRLDGASIGVFGDSHVSESIWSSTRAERLFSAEDSYVFTDEELKHPHLTTEHNDRDIAHDYIRLIMKKVDEHD